LPKYILYYNFMKTLINMLPKDIISHIITYTYNLQNKQLLNDIINYNISKKKLSELYYNFWIIQSNHPEPEDKYWLINDIFAYANGYNATMYGYIANFYNIFRRNIFLQTNEQIDQYVELLEEKDVTSQINIFLGLLTTNERNDILSQFININININVNL